MTEITPSFIYWITRLDGIIAYSSIIFTVSGIALIFFIIALIFLKIGNDKGNNAYHISIISKCLKLTLLICSLSSMSMLFIPTTKEMCAIHIIPKIINNEKIQEIGREFYDLSLDWMKELRLKTYKKHQF